MSIVDPWEYSQRFQRASFLKTEIVEHILVNFISIAEVGEEHLLLWVHADDLSEGLVLGSADDSLTLRDLLLVLLLLLDLLPLGDLLLLGFAWLDWLAEGRRGLVVGVVLH